MVIKMYKAIFKFHNIGQGLFYSGVISDKKERSFVFVYDCGSASQGCILNTEIDRFKENLNNNRIDLLVISHFHYDHIKGIPYLLKNKTIKVDTVIMQDLSEIQKFENYLYYRKQNKKGDIELSRLILNPIEYFLEKGVNKIVLVSNNDENIGNYYTNDNDKNDNNENNENNANNQNDVNLIYHITINNNYIVNKKNNIIYVKNNMKCQNMLWEFCFACDKQTNMDIHNKICEYLKNNNCTIKDLISCETKIKELIALLNIKPKPKFNESSMILVHHPIKQSNRYNILYYKCRESVSCDYCYRCLKHNYYNYCYHGACSENCNIPLSTILTGDVVLNNTINNVIKQFVNHNIPIIFQVPHHGSKSNSVHHISFINNYSKICSIIPCGYMYNHPSDEVYCGLDRPYIVDVRYRYIYIIEII